MSSPGALASSVTWRALSTSCRVADLRGADADFGQRHLDDSQVTAQLVGGEGARLERIQDRCGLFGLLRIEPGEDGRKDALFLLVEAGEDAFLSGLQVAHARRNLGQDRLHLAQQGDDLGLDGRGSCSSLSSTASSNCKPASPSSIMVRQYSPSVVGMM